LNNFLLCIFICLCWGTYKLYCCWWYYFF